MAWFKLGPGEAWAGRPVLFEQRSWSTRFHLKALHVELQKNASVYNVGLKRVVNQTSCSMQNDSSRMFLSSFSLLTW